MWKQTTTNWEACRPYGAMGRFSIALLPNRAPTDLPMMAARTDLTVAVAVAP